VQAWLMGLETGDDDDVDDDDVLKLNYRGNGY